MIGCRLLTGTVLVCQLSMVGALPIALLQDQETPENLISVSVRDVKLDKVLRILSEKSGMEFISDPSVKNKQITLNLSEVAPLEALSILAQLYDLGFQQLSKSGKYVVSDKSEIQVSTKIDAYTCEFAHASSLVPLVAKVVTPGIGSVLADDRTNTIIYQDTPPHLIEIERLIRTLDRPSRQVYIKGVIAEISVTKEHERGVQWFTERDNMVAGTDFALKGMLSGLPTEPTLPAISAGLGVGIIDYDIDVVIGLLSKTSDLNLLSAPYLIMLDNETAIIEVGDQIPYPKLNEYGITSYEFKDATIRLKLRPHINNDSTITVYLEPQANFQQGFTPDGIPIIAKRSAQTQVVVEQGKTVVLGGLMRESDVKTSTRVPIVGSIPLIGEFFKHTQVTKQKTELVVLLTPKIVDTFSPEMRLGPDAEVSEQLLEKIR